jgi:hypothetical protein
MLLAAADAGFEAAAVDRAAFEPLGVDGAAAVAPPASSSSSAAAAFTSQNASSAVAASSSSALAAEQIQTAIILFRRISPAADVASLPELHHPVAMATDAAACATLLRILPASHPWRASHSAAASSLPAFMLQPTLRRLWDPPPSRAELALIELEERDKNDNPFAGLAESDED